MKKVFIILCISAVVTACGGNSNSNNSGGADSVQGSNQTAKENTTNADTNTTKTGTESTGQSGESLIAAADCSSCHKTDEKVIGPAFQDVAAKYKPTKDNIDMLANKIINGGSGVWGDVPMTPHPAVSVGDAETMVKYILSLKK